MKVIFNKRLEVLEEGRLVRKELKKIQESACEKSVRF